MLEATVEYRKTKVLNVPTERLLKEYGLDPARHRVLSVHGATGNFHETGCVPMTVAITLQEIEVEHREQRR